MRACVCACVCLCVCMHACVCVHAYVCVQMHMHAYLLVRVCEVDHNNKIGTYPHKRHHCSILSIRLSPEITLCV